MKFFYLTICALLLLFACSTNKQAIDEKEIKELAEPTEKMRPSAYDNGKFFKQNGIQMLYGGKDSTQHFNIDNSDLINTQFHYGIGREVFPALLDPKFTSIEIADTIWADSTRFLVAFSGDEVKAYSVKDLTIHEVVNDMLNGKPIMAAYCILADLGAIYERTYGDKVLTFALSGYTYYDSNIWNGLDGFILWDRETESLWWPLVGKAVSGPLKDVKFQEMDKIYWKDTSWGEIKTSFPNAKILVSNQDYERPTSWTKIKDLESFNSYK